MFIHMLHQLLGTAVPGDQAVDQRRKYEDPVDHRCAVCFALVNMPHSLRHHRLDPSDPLGVRRAYEHADSAHGGGINSFSSPCSSSLILAGSLMESSGDYAPPISLADALAGHIRGGLEPCKRSGRYDRGGHVWSAMADCAVTSKILFLKWSGSSKPS